MDLQFIAGVIINESQFPKPVHELAIAIFGPVFSRWN
jgi:hypothetical protein